MRAVLAGLLAAGACSLAAAPAASASPVAPRSATAFYDSVGVLTHIVYYDTAYGDWPRIVARLRELGVRHIRDGIFANPTLQWHDWNDRYYSAVESAASQGMRFTFVVNPPGVGTGTLDQLLDVVGGRLRNAAEALEAPNEMDKYVGGARWPLALASYERQLHVKAKARRPTRSLPILGPSFATLRGPSLVGSLRGLVDVGNIHPYTGGCHPTPSTSSPSSSALGSRPRASRSGRPRSGSTTRCLGGQPGAGLRAGRRDLPAEDVPRAVPRRHPPHFRVRADRREARPGRARRRAALRLAAQRLQPQAGVQRAPQPVDRRGPRSAARAARATADRGLSARPRSPQARAPKGRRQLRCRALEARQRLEHQAQEPAAGGHRAGIGAAPGGGAGHPERIRCSERGSARCVYAAGASG